MKKENRKKNMRRAAYTLSKLLVFSLAAAVLFTFVFGITLPSDNGMYPRISEGDVVMYYRLAEEYRTGDAVVYESDGKTFPGRIAAMGGDTVAFSGDGRLLLNGMSQAGDSSFYPTYETDGAGIDFPMKVEDGSYFILSDYRTGAANDSRNTGTVPGNQIKGKVFAVLRRRDF